MKFLVVDDSSTMRRIIINTLKRIGEEDFVEAANGEEGWNALNGDHPFFIVLQTRTSYCASDVLVYNIR